VYLILKSVLPFEEVTQLNFSKTKIIYNFYR